MWDLLSYFIAAVIRHVRDSIVGSPDWLFSRFAKKDPPPHMAKTGADLPSRVGPPKVSVAARVPWLEFLNTLSAVRVK